jgi:leucyl aminopeptidase
VLDIRVTAGDKAAKAVVLPVRPSHNGAPAIVDADMTDSLAAQSRVFLADVEHTGAPGVLHLLPRPGQDPGHVLFVGVGAGQESDWRAAGAAVARAASHRLASVSVTLPDGVTQAFAEGAWLASYRFRMSPDPAEPKLRRVSVCAPGVTLSTARAALSRSRAIVDAVVLARDLTNMPSAQKSPAWLADRLAKAAARHRGVNVSVLDEIELAQAGFGGLLAVGGGSARPPRLLEMSWRPRGAKAHIVLVGKGITFDTGGICIKPKDGMKLMRKDMGGAATVCAALFGAADLDIPVRLTVLAPLAENMISGSAYRPADVVRHYGGITTEVHNTDAEGRVVLGDALAYAAHRLKPDLLLDFATLTGASQVALGKRIGALFTHDDALANALISAGEQTGERVWRLPLPEEYAPMVASEVADLTNSPTPGHAGAVMAALYLREFTGALREQWAHVDMSGPSWSESSDGVLVRGATGWGVRLVLRWLASYREG